MATGRARWRWVGSACLAGWVPLAPPAWGQVDAPGAYLAAGAGPVRVADLNRGAVNGAFSGQGLAVRTVAVDDSAPGWHLLAGYRFSRHLAVEGGYTDLGRYRFQGQVLTDPGSVQARLALSSLNLFALGLVPLRPDLELFGKLGLGHWRSRLAASGRFAGSEAHAASSSGTGPAFGLGARYAFTPAWSARLEWTRFLHVGTAARTGRVDLDFGSLGLQYHF